MSYMINWDETWEDRHDAARGVRSVKMTVNDFTSPAVVHTLSRDDVLADLTLLQRNWILSYTETYAPHERNARTRTAMQGFADREGFVFGLNHHLFINPDKREHPNAIFSSFELDLWQEEKRRYATLGAKVDMIDHQGESLVVYVKLDDTTGDVVHFATAAIEGATACDLTYYGVSGPDVAVNPLVQLLPRLLTNTTLLDMDCAYVYAHVEPRTPIFPPQAPVRAVARPAPRRKTSMSETPEARAERIEANRKLMAALAMPSAPVSNRCVDAEIPPPAPSGVDDARVDAFHKRETEKHVAESAAQREVRRQAVAAKVRNAQRKAAAAEAEAARRALAARATGGRAAEEVPGASARARAKGRKVEAVRLHQEALAAAAEFKRAQEAKVAEDERARERALAVGDAIQVGW